MKKQIISLFSLLLLCSCSSKENKETAKPTETNAPSVTENVTEATATDNKTEETTTDTEDNVISEGIHRMTKDDIPETAQSKYNTDFDFEAGGISYHGDYLQRGTGSYDGTIQMKKEQSFFYSMVAVKGKLTLSLLDKGAYTGTPTLYVGNTINPQEETSKVTFSSRQESAILLYEATVDGYFRLADESGFALYLNYVEIDCTVSL